MIRFSCKGCGLWQQSKYKRKRITPQICSSILVHHNNSMGISDISRTLEIGKSTVIKYLKRMANRLVLPKVRETNQVYEVDEMYTYIAAKGRECWIAYAINRETRKPVGYVIGRRTTENLARLITPLLDLNPKTICTDRLVQYRTLIPKHIHQFKRKSTNRIERKNLTIRTHLKRLARRTICYSKSVEMLEVSLRLYLFKSDHEPSGFSGSFSYI